MLTQSCIHVVGGNFFPEQTGNEFPLDENNAPFSSSTPFSGKHPESFDAPPLLHRPSDILDLVFNWDFESKVDSTGPSWVFVGRIMQEDPSLRK
uniref:Uncharacterized protein n=1 Tax=Arundo donax TaxID=35708 RepID=A0A0A9ECP2_ARUDO